MIASVADTHTALWHLFDDKRLSAAAEAFINEAATARGKIAISTISLAEVVYLIELSLSGGETAKILSAWATCAYEFATSITATQQCCSR